MNEQQRRWLQTYYQQTYPDKTDVTLNDVVTIGAGWESELYGFVAEFGPALTRTREEQVLRIYEGDIAPTRARHEFTSLRRLGQARYPVPQVHLLELARSPFDKPFIIMERIEGQVLWTLLDRATPAQRQALLTQFCQLFVQLHSLDWRPFVDVSDPFDAEDPYTFVDRWLASGQESLQRFPHLDFDPIVDWLYQQRAEMSCERPAAVHRDFHPGNVLVQTDGSAIVIDWTGFGVTDARFDLAWTLMLANAYGGAELRNHILHEYERSRGGRVAQIEIFEIFACASRLFDVSVSLSEGAERLGMRSEAVRAMREQIDASQRVYDLLVEQTTVRLPEVERILGLDRVDKSPRLNEHADR